MKKMLYSILTLFTFVILVFLPDSFAQTASPEYVVRVIYFLPSDRTPQPDINAKLDRVIKNTQLFYAKQMTAHGFGSKTFQFEADTAGKVVVHRINGQFNDAYYNSGAWEKIWQEIEGQFDLSNNIWLTALDTRAERINNFACGMGGGGSLGGRVLMPASGSCFSVRVAAHELGHAFGLQHDNRIDGRWIPSAYTSDRMITSFCSAEWLDVHRYFEINQTLSAIEGLDPSLTDLLPSAASGTTHLCGVGSLDGHESFKINQTAPGDTLPTCEMLGPPSLAAAPNAIRLRFKVTDTDGLHQVRLHTPEWDPYVAGEFIACKRISGTSATVEFVTTELSSRSESVHLWVIDVHGNFYSFWRTESYPINVTTVLPAATAISIPDTQLAAAIQQKIGNITTHSLLDLRTIDATNHTGITDLTGLEYAYNLKHLRNARGGGITDLRPLTNLTGLTSLDLREHQIRDISPLGTLTNLSELLIWRNQISDITTLGNLTNLTWLGIDSNQISDITVLQNLTNLRGLGLGGNQIRDITALSGLTNLRGLWLSVNQIRDITALSGLTNLTILHLQHNQIRNVHPLVNLINLEELYLVGNSIEDISPLQTLLANNPNLKIDIDVPPPPPTGLTFSPSAIADQTFTVGTSVSLTLPIATGGTAPYTYTLSPLPDGLQFDGAARLLTGTPTSGGTTNTTYTARDAGGQSTSLTFTITVNTTGGTDGVTDTNLAVAIRRSLGVPADTQLTAALLQQLTTLNGYAQRITSLTGLEQATNLTTLDLGANQITDISAVASLTQLTHLYLDDNQITDVSPLVGLRNLRLLRLAGNPINDTSPLSTLVAQNPGLDLDIPVTQPPPSTDVTFTDTKLETAVRTALGLGPGAPLTTVEMQALGTLEAYDRRIASISGLEHATNLVALDLGKNDIVDISPLATLTQLEILYLDDNQIVDVSPLAGLTNLETLFLTGNPIESLAPISHLIGNIRVFRARLAQ